MRVTAAYQRHRDGGNHRLLSPVAGAARTLPPDRRPGHGSRCPSLGDVADSGDQGERDTRVTAWALAAGAGDRTALEAFVRATQRDVWRFLAHLTDVSRAHEKPQETSLRAISRIPRFAPRNHKQIWLLSIARRVVVDQVRAALARPRTTPGGDWIEAADAAQTREQAAVGFEDIVEVNLLLAELDADRREALILTQVLGLPYAEAAEICGCPVGTIRSRVARARDDLQRGLGQRYTGTS